METKPEATVVGIGASAGGLAALKVFFQHVPSDCGLSFVVVVHLSPDHESHLAELLQPHVRLSVEQVTGDTLLEPNHVYVIPPNANLSAIDTHLRLSELEQRRGERAPIDHFFRTLARSHDGNAIAVVLTGTGSDGTLGVKDVRANGGLVIVQEPNDAEYDGMPQSAIATGLVDFILPVSQIPANILRFDRTNPRIALPTDGEDISQDERMLLQKVFAQLRARTDRDFSRYKRSTVLRRIARRMQLNYLEDLSHYLERLRERPDEVRLLADDLLITVTHFFRDPEVFDKLQQEIIPKLFAAKNAQDSVRAWSVGCATGEEAYSLAILMAEEAQRHEQRPQIQIFASDLHAQSLEKAREGLYSGDIETDVSPARLKEFFLRENGGYRIRKDIREMVIFTPHNLLADPPFSRQDLISCRNLLIYLERDVQSSVIELFHYALNPHGTLLLGPAEAMDDTDLFRVEHKRLCLFRKRNVPAREPHLPVFPLMRDPRLSEAGSRGKHVAEPLAYASLHQQMMERYSPASMLVSQDNKILHLSEHAGRYLLHPRGEPTASLLLLVRQELRIELQAALRMVREKNLEVDSVPIPVRFDGETRPVVLRVRPALDQEREGFALVIFEEREPHTEPETNGSPDRSRERTRELENELHLSRQRLQAVIEEHETSREEMKASNEEMQSTNEELLSTMEELETSKEELQSINEELQTVNQQNRIKVEELAQLSSDLQNLLTATDIATLFLDREMRILRFTPKLGELFNVRATDRGRPISDLTHRLGYADLCRDAVTVLDRLAPIECEIQDDTGRWYLTRVLPYRSTEDRIEGTVITFIDIDTRKRAEEQVQQAMLYSESIVESLRDPLLVLGPGLEVRSSNPAFYRHFGLTPEVTLGRKIYDLGNGQWNLPELRMLLEEILPEKHVIQDFEIQYCLEGLGQRTILINAHGFEHLQLILLGLSDVTERRRVEEQRTEILAKDLALAGEKTLRRTEAELARVVRALSIGELAASIAHEINQPLTGVVTNAEAATRWLSGDSPNIPEAMQSLNLIVRDGNRASQVIQRIRAFLKNDDPQTQTLEINEVVQEAIALIPDEFGKRGITLGVELANGLSPVQGDRIQLQQVIFNLIMNAMDATTSVEGRREISVSSQRSPHGGVQVAVRDSGIGVSANNMSRIFDAFFTTKQSGLGMGLALSRSIVEAHGGRIWAESSDGQGLKVQFTLPAA